MKMIQVTFVAALPVFISACSSGGHPKAAPAELPPVAVKVEKAAERAWPMTKQAMGTVEARTRATVAAQVMGVIREVRVQAGQSVAAGQVLARLEARELDAAVAQAEASRAEALSANDEIDKAIESARVEAGLAESSHRRIAELFAKKSVSPQEMDEANARLRQARANVERAESRRSQVTARAESASRAIASAKVLAGYTNVVAPFAGVVAEKLANAGSLAAPGTPLFVIEQGGGYQLAITVEESERLRPGQPLQVVWDDGAGPVETKVTEIVPAMDAGTRTQTVKAALPAAAAMRSGRFGRAVWTVGERQALTVPASALRAVGQLQMTLVVENGKLRSRMITAGETRQGMVEVLSGLRAGETVVVNPPLEWQDGAPARVE